MPPIAEETQAPPAQSTTTEQVPDQAQQQTQAPEPFTVDEATLATLSPEQRQAVDPLLTNWRKTAQEAIKKEVDAVSKKYSGYSDYEKKSKALDQLVQDPRFVQWYRQTVSTPTQGQPQQPNNQVATPEQWAEAVQEASSGNPEKLVALNELHIRSLAQPVLKNLADRQMALSTQIEVDNLYKRHPDAEELNNLGVQNDNDFSLLELVAHEVIDKRGGNWEQAYTYARKIADSFASKSKQETLGLINSKKGSVTEGASKTIKDSPTVIEVESAEKALRENVKAAFQGRTNVTYVSKPRFVRK